MGKAHDGSAAAIVSVFANLAVLAWTSPSLSLYNLSAGGTVVHGPAGGGGGAGAGAGGGT